MLRIVNPLENVLNPEKLLLLLWTKASVVYVDAAFVILKYVDAAFVILKYVDAAKLDAKYVDAAKLDVKYVVDAFVILKYVLSQKSFLTRWLTAVGIDTLQIGVKLLKVAWELDIKLLSIVVDVDEIINGVVFTFTLSFTLKLYVVLIVLLGSSITSLFKSDMITLLVEGVVSYNNNSPPTVKSPPILTLVLFITKGLYVLPSLILKV